MEYFDEREVIKRVRQRIRRRFLFWSHFLISLAVMGLGVIAIHHRYTQNAINGLPPDRWVGSWNYTYEITTMLSVLAYLLVPHLLYFLYREVMTRAVHREMTALRAARPAHMPIQANDIAAKKKRGERLSLSDDGEIIAYADEDEAQDYLPDYREQWQRN